MLFPKWTMTHFTGPGRPFRIQRRKWLHLANFSELTQRLHLPKGSKSRKTRKVWESNRFREYQLEYLMLQEGIEKNGKQDTATCHWRKGEIHHLVICLCISLWMQIKVSEHLQGIDCYGHMMPWSVVGHNVTPHTTTEWRKNNEPCIERGRQKPQQSENPQPSPT